MRLPARLQDAGPTSSPTGRAHAASAWGSCALGADPSSFLLGRKAALATPTENGAKPLLARASKRCACAAPYSALYTCSANPHTHTALAYCDPEVARFTLL